jgi:hypothetical protein
MPGPRLTRGQVDRRGRHADQLGADWYQQASVTSGDARYTAEVASVRGGSGLDWEMVCTARDSEPTF